MQYWPLCVAGLLIQIAFIIVESKKKYLPAVILKGSASVVFVILGLLCAKTAANEEFAKLVTVGLLLGALGDILLNLRYVFAKIGQTIFLAGIAAFLTGHILYLAALVVKANRLVLCLFAGLILATLLLTWIFRTLGQIKKSFKIFGVLYIGVISLMTAVAAGNLLAALGASADATGSLLFFIGAVLFLLSDVIMILNTFGKQQKQVLRTSNLLLYYAGQLLIALSLLFF